MFHEDTQDISQSTTLFKTKGSTSKKAIDARIEAQHDSVMMQQVYAQKLDCLKAINTGITDLTEIADDLEYLKEQLVGLKKDSSEVSSPEVSDLMGEIDHAVSDVDSTRNGRPNLKHATLEEYQCYLHTCEGSYDDAKQVVLKAVGLLDTHDVQVQLNCTAWGD